VGPASRLNEIVQEVHDAGWRVCVHANGDRAIRHVLDAIERAQRRTPRPIHGTVSNTPAS
jgi:predicted amidohydrolase YtcJ